MVPGASPVRRALALLLERRPMLKAPPIVLARRADLIGETETVEPTFLFGAPAAVPDELVARRARRSLHLNGAGEVGAAGAPAERDALDRQKRFGGEDVGEQASHLHRGGEPFDMDQVRRSVPAVTADGMLERFERSRPFENLFQI